MDALILSCGTGGGHDAAARAVKEELLRRGNHVVMMNPYMLQSRQLAQLIDHVYISIAQNMPRFFGLAYKMAEGYRKLPWRSPVYFLNGKMVPIMENCLRQNHFDVVIMTHLFPAEIMTQMKNRGIAIPKTVFIATDYTCIPFAEETDCDAYIIPAEQLRGEYQNRGIPDEKIFPLGIPVCAAFMEQAEKEAVRKNLGLEPDKNYLLISGGSIGAGKLKKTVRFLYRQCDETMRLIVICGNNDHLYNSLTEEYGDTAVILRSTDKMAQYMQASDLYFVKPGGLSSTEAAVMGVPLVHLPPIPGCETKNADFFRENGMNFVTSARKGKLEQAVSLMADPSKCAQMVSNQRKVIRADASSDICDFVESLVGGCAAPSNQ